MPVAKAKELDDVFYTLRNRVKTKCKCGNNQIVAPHFHKADCPYRPEAEKLLGYLPEKGELKNG